MRFLLLLCLFVLVSCSSSDPASKMVAFTPPDTVGGRLCVTQCSEARDSCQEACGLKQRDCVRKIQTQAMADYDKYTREQFASHTPIEFRPRDFENTEACDRSKKNCGEVCGDKYQTCYEGCGGVVSTMTSCQFFCF